MTLRTELGVPNHNTPLDLRPLSSENAMVKVYFALVETLSRFRELYTEPHLLGLCTTRPWPSFLLPNSIQEESTFSLPQLEGPILRK